MPHRPARPSWVNHAILWHVYPLGFVGAPATADGEPAIPRLARLLRWLDYLVELGANGLLLGPVFASETHGYDTVDHFRIDPRLGTESDMETLLAEARARGIRVVLDGVFNHVARSFPAVKDLARQLPDGSLATFEGHQQLVALNHDDARVAEYVSEVMQHWLARGVDGWRLDAAYAVGPRFWRDVLGRVRSTYPDAWFLGEMIHGEYAGYVEQSTVNSVTQYELWKAIWSSLNDRNFFELAHALRRHDRLLDTFVPQTFIGNHDVTRLASRLIDRSTLPLAVAVLMTVAGIPSVYAGDEQAMTGVKEDRPGGDDAIRPAFPEHPEELSTLGAEIYRTYHRLIALRRQHPWLVSSRCRVLDVTNTRLVYRSSADSTQALTITVDLGATQPTWSVH